MKQFFKIMFASMLGALLSFFVLIVLFFLVIAGIVASAGSSQEPSIKENSILRISLSTPIVERSAENPFKNFDFINLEGNTELGLNKVILAIEKASDDPNISGIYLDLSSVEAGLASTAEIRHALINFRKSGKFIYAYSEVYSQKAYYLASVADSIYLNPYGLLEWKGLSAQYMFFKAALDKLEIEPQIIRVGSFKSAVEPFMLEKMSDSSRLQSSTYLNTLFQIMSEEISVSRKIPMPDMISMANELRVRNANDAVSQKLVDGLVYKDELLEILRRKVGAENTNSINFIELPKYMKQLAPNTSVERNKIAIIYANGDIVSGEGSEDIIGSEGISAAIRKARLDEQVKAVVLRINSPGGSALASDVIWREVELCKNKKPVVASMGDVAASGGYYIACAANKIVAQPTTITGSIGVFGVLFNTEKFFKNKLGISFDRVKTSEFADLGDMTRALTTTERAIIQTEINRIYDEFIAKVASGRDMPVEKVKSIAEGRVWSGKDALAIHLVDTLGDIQTAIDLAAQLAKIDQYKIMSLPSIEEPISELMKSLNAEASTWFMPASYKALIPYQESLQSIQRNKGIQMRASSLPIIE